MAYKILKPVGWTLVHEVWIIARASWLFWLLLVMSAFFVVVFLLITVGSIQKINQFGLLIFGIWPIIFLLTYFLFIKIKAVTSLWMKIAKINGWEFRPTSDLKEEGAVMFQQGHSGIIFRRIDGAVDGRKFRAFNYMFTIGRGKHRRVYKYTVFAFKFNGSFPHVYLNNKHNSYSVNIGEKIPIPTEFEKQFILSAPRKYEIEAMEIFTPDVLYKLLDKKIAHDIEFVGQEMIIFIDGITNNFEKFEKEFNIAVGLEDLFDEKLDRFKFEKIGDMSHQLK